MQPEIKPKGPLDAEIMIIGENPIAEDCRHAEPFCGYPGNELNTMLSAVGISIDSCYRTYVCKARPPRGATANFFINVDKLIASTYLIESKKELLEEIENVRPKLIICLGGLASWAVTGQYSITKWRGSQLQYAFADGTNCWVLPTYSPSFVLRQWIVRSTTINDLRRASRYATWKVPEYDFTIRPTLETVLGFISELEQRAAVSPVLVSGDIETRGGHIACLGIGVSKTRAICIPFMDIKKPDSHYWREDEEVAIVQRLVALFRNDKVRWCFQNGAYDFQYFARWWGTSPYLATDTMLEHHVAWTGDLPKGLDFLSSMYCSFHVYWKEDGKLWDPRYTPEEDLWRYNCRDCVVTWEVAMVLASQTEALGLETQVTFQTMRQFPAVLKMMLRGVRCDTARKARLSVELAEAYAKMEERLHHLCCEPLNVRSPKQMATFFYDTLGLPEQRNRKTHKRSTDAKCLPLIWKKAAWVKPITDLVENMRSVGVFKSTFIDMRLDTDDRIRCSYGIAGTETLRYNSSQNAFGSGMNLQNIPEGDETSHLPNVKNIFIPDEGYIIGEADLSQADAQVVAWEANDEKLKYIFRNKIDLHLANASDMYDLKIRLEDIADPDGIKWHTERFPRFRQAAKAGCHAINYGAKEYTLSITLGLSQRDAKAFIDKWFSEHPGIRDWHERIEIQLQSTREVRNRFGFRRYYFDRVDGLLPEALAWVPQSTVALVIDHGLVNINEQLADVHPLLQVHDSLVFQFQTVDQLPAIQQAMTIPIPYEDPLIIPVSLKVSRERWGAKKEISWDYQGEITW